MWHCAARGGGLTATQIETMRRATLERRSRRPSPGVSVLRTARVCQTWNYPRRPRIAALVCRDRRGIEGYIAGNMLRQGHHGVSRWLASGRPEKKTSASYNRPHSAARVSPRERSSTHHTPQTPVQRNKPLRVRAVVIYRLRAVVICRLRRRGCGMYSDERRVRSAQRAASAEPSGWGCRRRPHAAARACTDLY